MGFSCKGSSNAVVKLLDGSEAHEITTLHVLQSANGLAQILIQYCKIFPLHEDKTLYAKFNKIKKVPVLYASYS